MKYSYSGCLSGRSPKLQQSGKHLDKIGITGGFHVLPVHHVPNSCVPQMLTACLLAMLALKCQSNIAMGNTHLICPKT